MNKKTPNKAYAMIALAIMLLLLLFAYEKGTGLRQISNEVVISLDPTEQIIEEGDILRLDINAKNAISLGGVQLDVGYNPRVLRYNRVTEGSFLKQGNTDTFFFQDIVDTSTVGVVKNIVLAKVGSGGANGNGLIVSVYFDAINSGSSGLKLENGIIADARGNALSVDKVNSSVSVINTQATNSAPDVSQIFIDLADVDPQTEGVQLYENTTAVYSVSATDPDDDVLIWKWLYTIENIAEETINEGTGDVQPAAFTYVKGTGGITYNWKLIVSDGKNTEERNFKVQIINGTSEDISKDEDDDGIRDIFDKCRGTKKIGGKNPKVNKYGCRIPKHDKFSPELTTNLSDVDLANFTGFKIGIRDRGQIDYNKNLISLISDDLDELNLDDAIEFLPLRVAVHSDKLNALNMSAIISILNIANITNPVVYKNSEVCTDCKLISFSNNALRFEVGHFTEYSVREGSYCGDSFCSAEESCSSCITDCGACPPLSSEGGASGGSSGGGGSGGGSSGGGGSGGGGSGGGAFGVCNMDWQCTDWSECTDGYTTRECNFVRVPQFVVRARQCPEESQSPEIAQACEFEEEKMPKPEEKAEETPKLSMEEQQQIEQTAKSKIQKTSKRLFFAFTFAILLIGVLISIYEFKVHLGPRNATEKTITEKELAAVKSYIDRERALGRSDASIKKTLERAGWPKKIIDKILEKK